MLRVPPNPCMAEARKEVEGLVGPVNVVVSGREVGGSHVHAVEDDGLIVFEELHVHGGDADAGVEQEPRAAHPWRRKRKKINIRG